MQEHLKHIQELEAERAAKHQEKRDKAKQKAPVRVDITPSRPARREASPSDGAFNEPVWAAAGPRGAVELRLVSARGRTMCHAAIAVDATPRRRRACRQRVYASRESFGTAERLEAAQTRERDHPRPFTNTGRGQKTGDAGAPRASGSPKNLRRCAPSPRRSARSRLKASNSRAVRLETEARIAREAADSGRERKRKVAEKLKKSQAILKEIERKKAEKRSRPWRKREARIKAIREVRSASHSSTRSYPQTRSWLVSFSSLRPFGPKRACRGRVAIVSIKRRSKKRRRRRRSA